MTLRPGIPLLNEVDTLLGDPMYAEQVAWNDAFLQRHGTALADYGKHWGQNPFRMWSRRWEYPFEATKVLQFVKDQDAGSTSAGDLDSTPTSAANLEVGAAKRLPLKMLDGGSGVTYVPYYLVERCPELSVVCCDTNASYDPMFAAINKSVGHQRVTFQEAALQKLPYETGGLDIVCCISVLEHTDNYAKIVEEFARVTRAGGLLVLTFDLSLDGKFPLKRETAADLLRGVDQYFSPLENLQPQEELSKLDDTAKLLSTDHVKKTDSGLLPWKSPALKAVHDLVTGQGWTGGFRSKSLFCFNGLRRG